MHNVILTSGIEELLIGGVNWFLCNILQAPVGGAVFSCRTCESEEKKKMENLLLESKMRSRVMQIITTDKLSIFVIFFFCFFLLCHASKDWEWKEWRPQVGVHGLSSATAGEKTQMDSPLSTVTTHKCLSKEARQCFSWPSDTRAETKKKDLKCFPLVHNVYSHASWYKTTENTWEQQKPFLKNHQSSNYL